MYNSDTYTTGTGTTTLQRLVEKFIAVTGKIFITSYLTKQLITHLISKTNTIKNNQTCKFLR